MKYYAIIQSWEIMALTLQGNLSSDKISNMLKCHNYVTTGCWVIEEDWDFEPDIDCWVRSGCRHNVLVVGDTVGADGGNGGTEGCDDDKRDSRRRFWNGYPGGLSVPDVSEMIGLSTTEGPGRGLLEGVLSHQCREHLA